ncbi:AraC family transcriptional regulator [Sphaerisporangium sp. NPDC005289]|uniref:AraC family transcriptional regulator n=1 Tax=Sphaerisporangium sp. NPDC005289 TaxID=3155247 RepID=UPI0033ABE9FC
MDPLSTVLSLLNVESALPLRFEAGGSWAMTFDGYPHVKCGAVLAGSCWIAVGDLAPVLVEAGDCYLINGGAPYRMFSDPLVEPVHASVVFRETVDAVLRWGGDEVVIVGGPITLDMANARLLLDVLPPFVHAPAESDQAEVLQAALRLLARENAAPGLGSEFMTDRVAQIIFIQILRAHARAASGEGRAPGGWLSALMDPQIGTALRLMHQDNGRRWTVAELAAEVGMSRSSFAERFRSAVGSAPLDYLLRWRMHSAGQDLRATGRTISAVAAAWGYGSESAFSNAFKRVMGVSPRAYRAGRGAAQAAR